MLSAPLTFRANFRAAREWSNPKVGKRLLILEEHGFVSINAPSRGMVVHYDGPVAMVQITSAGEQALKQKPGQFKASSTTVAHKSVTFQGPVNAGNLAAGDFSQQTVSVTLTLGDLVKAISQAIEENPAMTEAQKGEAQTLVDKLKENLPHAAQITTLSNVIYTALNAAIGWMR